LLPLTLDLTSIQAFSPWNGFRSAGVPNTMSAL
jgi:hypothetical protein